MLVEELPGAGTLGKSSPKTSLLFLLHEQVPGFAVVPAPNVVNFVALVGGAAFVVESVVVKSVVVESVVAVVSGEVLVLAAVAVEGRCWGDRCCSPRPWRRNAGGSPACSPAGQ